MAWIRFDDDLLDDPEVAELERRRGRWPLLWAHMATLARASGAGGRILFAPGRPWTIEQLAYRRRVTPREYRLFTEAALEIGLLEMHSDGGFCLPARWRHLWSNSAGPDVKAEPVSDKTRPMTDAERQARRRARQTVAPREPEATPTTADPQDLESACHDARDTMSRNVTNERDNMSRRVTEERDTMSRNVTPVRDTMTVQNRTERDVTNNGTQTFRDLGSLEPQKPIADFGEERFWEQLARVYEHFVRKRWTGSDKTKAIGCLRQPWATSQPNWLIRYYAILSGLQHMSESPNVENPWGYALSMAHKYSDVAEEFVTSNARRKAGGHDLKTWKFRRLEPLEDCYGPDYEMRGDEEAA